MEYKNQHIVARKIASLLAESEATVSDLPLIFEKVRESLRVAYREPDKRDFFTIGGITVPPNRTKNGETYIPSPSDLLNDGDRRGDE